MIKTILIHDQWLTVIDLGLSGEWAVVGGPGTRLDCTTGTREQVSPSLWGLIFWGCGLGMCGAWEMRGDGRSEWSPSRALPRPRSNLQRYIGSDNFDDADDSWCLFRPYGTFLPLLSNFNFYKKVLFFPHKHITKISLREMKLISVI